MTRTSPPSEPDLDATLGQQAARLEKVIAEMRAARPRPRAGAPMTDEAGEISALPSAPPSPSAEASAVEAMTAVEPAATVAVAPPKASSKKVRPSTVVAPTAPEAPSHTAYVQQTHIATASREHVAGEADARATHAPPLRETNRVGEASTIGLKKPIGQRHGELWDALSASRRSFWAVCRTSIAINMLMLTGPLFMLQVYDRVMTSGSVTTLLALSGLTAALYAVIGLLEYIRSHVIVRMGVEADQRIGNRIFQASLNKSLTVKGSAVPALRELDTLRNFLAGPGPLTFFDAIFTPVYLLVVFSLHWSLGVAAHCWRRTAGDHRMGQRQAEPRAARRSHQSRNPQPRTRRYRPAECGIACGDGHADRVSQSLADGQSRGAWRGKFSRPTDLGGLSAVSKALRLLLQSLMLAIGAGLALKGEITAGSIVAATIIFGRAIAPVEQAISQWRSFIKAMDSYRKLEDLLKSSPAPQSKIALPRPRGHLEISGLRVAAPETKQLILSNLNFEVRPGDVLAVIGPSASGKSTLARTLVGLWAPFAGAIRLDGARLDQWDSESLGRHIGYLPQDVELFAGTVRENISRFREDATDDAIISAAQQAHAHELIMALPKGYDTQLGAFGTYLSAGQRQRVALARALYDSPALIVLDEPNANLDRAGDEALAAAVDGMRARGQAVVIISHRVQAIGKADTLLYIERGIQKAFGPRNDVMKLFAGGQTQPQAAQHSAAGAQSRAATATRGRVTRSCDFPPPQLCPPNRRPCRCRIRIGMQPIPGSASAIS